MKKLLCYLKGYEKETVLAPLFKMLEALFELFVPLVMAAVIDQGIGGSDKPYIVRMCMLLIALGVIGLVCSITAQYFAAKAATGFSTRLRHELFAHIQGLSYTEMDTLGTSTLITRMTSDINQVQSGVNLVLRLFLRSPFIVFGAMIMAFTVDAKAALIFVVTIPLLSIVVFGIMLWTMPLYKKVQAALDQVLGLTRENLTGVRVIRAFNKEEEELSRYQEIRRQNLRSDEPHYLCDRQRFDYCAVVYRRDPRRFRHPDPGTDRSACQLHVPDSGRACQAGEPDYHGDKSDRLRQPCAERAGSAKQYGAG